MIRRADCGISHRQNPSDAIASAQGFHGDGKAVSFMYGPPAGRVESFILAGIRELSGRGHMFEMTNCQPGFVKAYVR